MRRILPLATVALLAAPAAQAQQIDCMDPQNTNEATFCAEEAWIAADGELNLAYGLAITMAKRIDERAGLEDRVQDPPAEELLRDAQRKWIEFRDAACAAESQLAEGGTSLGLRTLTCLGRLTLRRTEDLVRFGETN